MVLLPLEFFIMQELYRPKRPIEIGSEMDVAYDYSEAASAIINAINPDSIYCINLYRKLPFQLLGGPYEYGGKKFLYLTDGEREYNKPIMQNGENTYNSLDDTAEENAGYPTGLISQVFPGTFHCNSLIKHGYAWVQLNQYQLDFPLYQVAVIPDCETSEADLSVGLETAELNAMSMIEQMLSGEEDPQFLTDPFRI